MLYLLVVEGNKEEEKEEEKEDKNISLHLWSEEYFVFVVVPVPSYPK